jgi:hypothetical protein
MTSHPTAVRAAATTCLVLAALVAAAATPGVARASRFSVDLWTDRGSEAVYRPGETIDIGFRVSDDAHLLVYEIDSEGYVRVLFPHRRGDDFVPGGRDLGLPQRDDAEWVVQGPVGEGYIVAIASIEPFEPLPWYLRPRDTRGDELGYYGDPEEIENENVTAEGRIVGDPFVAMERIRRRVLADAEDRYGFATDYTSYYVHNAVRYPRYLCYDCHRPGRWAWWDGFDPYYTSCRVVDFRINVAWGWGPTYWFGYVPYYTYIYRHDCPPRYLPPGVVPGGWCGTSWDGWPHWRKLWDGPLRRYKSPPPAGYVPPDKWADSQRWKSGTRKPLPPGFLAPAHAASGPGLRRTTGRGATGGNDRAPAWVGTRTRRDGGSTGSPGLGTPRGETPSGRSGRASEDQGSVREERLRRGGQSEPGARPNRGAEPAPGTSPWVERGERSPRRETAPPRGESGRDRAPAPEFREPPRNPDPPRRSDPPPSGESQRAPRNDPPPRSDPPPRYESPRNQPPPQPEAPQTERKRR